MPVTFLHPTFAYLINRWNPQFSLPAILVGTVIPDLEVPILYFLTGGAIDRLVFHSIIGAATVGTIVSVVIVLIIYPQLVSFFFRINKKDVEKKCRFSGTLFGLCMIGNLSHVLIDATHHEFNPLLYPIFEESVNFLRITGDRVFDGGIVTLVLSAILFVFVIDSLRKGLKNFWKQMLFG
jgi:membrane-bound metal-dependent hydrolase YbcI (DUF457 family)